MATRRERTYSAGKAGDCRFRGEKVVRGAPHSLNRLSNPHQARRATRNHAPEGTSKSAGRRHPGPGLRPNITKRSPIWSSRAHARRCCILSRKIRPLKWWPGCRFCCGKRAKRKVWIRATPAGGAAAATSQFPGAGDDCICPRQCSNPCLPRIDTSRSADAPGVPIAVGAASSSPRHSSSDMTLAASTNRDGRWSRSGKTAQDRKNGLAAVLT